MRDRTHPKLWGSHLPVPCNLGNNHRTHNGRCRKSRRQPPMSTLPQHSNAKIPPSLRQVVGKEKNPGVLLVPGGPLENVLAVDSEFGDNSIFIFFMNQRVVGYFTEGCPNSPPRMPIFISTKCPKCPRCSRFSSIVGKKQRKRLRRRLFCF